MAYCDVVQCHPDDDPPPPDGKVLWAIIAILVGLTILQLFPNW